MGKINIYIEGIIGAGKTTLLEQLSHELSNSHIEVEPIDKWQKFKNNNNESILDLFYKDISKYSYLFQSTAFLTRIKQFKEVINNKQYKYGFFERSVFADRYCFAQNCYESGIMSDIEWKIYTDWFDWLVDEFKLNTQINAFIYIKTSNNVAIDRINARHRECENSISNEYISKLSQKHDDMISILQSKWKVLILDGDKDFKNDINILNEYVNKIKEFIQEIS